MHLILLSDFQHCHCLYNSDVCETSIYIIIILNASVILRTFLLVKNVMLNKSKTETHNKMVSQIVSNYTLGSVLLQWLISTKRWKFHIIKNVRVLTSNFYGSKRQYSRRLIYSKLHKVREYVGPFVFRQSYVRYVTLPK